MVPKIAFIKREKIKRQGKRIKKSNEKSGEKSCARLNEKGAKILRCVALSRSVHRKAE